MNDVKNISDIDKKTIPHIGWAYNPNIIQPSYYEGLTNPNSSSQNVQHFYMTHMVCSNSIITSPFFDHIIPVLKKLDIKSLIRIKCNLYPNSEKIHEHEKHTDYDFSHKTAMLRMRSFETSFSVTTSMSTGVFPKMEAKDDSSPSCRKSVEPENASLFSPMYPRTRYGKCSS